MSTQGARFRKNAIVGADPPAPHRRMSPTIADELDRIAERIGRLVQVVDELRDENHDLRIALDRSQAEGRVLKDRLDRARARIEGLIERLPSER